MAAVAGASKADGDMKGALLGMGNPLLDISAEVPIELVKK